MKSNNFKQSISIILVLLLLFSVTSCSVVNRKPVEQEMQNQETTETDKKSEEPQGVMVDGELRFYDGELVTTAKHLIKNGLTASSIHAFFEFHVDLNDTIVGNSGVIYSKVLNNRYGLKSLNEIEEFFAGTYSNEDTIHKISYRDDEPLFKEHNGQLYAYSDGSSGTVGYSIEDWYSIYLTDITETTAVVNYPLFHYWNGIDGAVVMHKNTITKVSGTWLLDNILEAKPIKLEEKITEELGLRSIFFRHLGRFNMSDFVGFEGETIEKNGIKYTNIGYILSPEDPFASYKYNSLEVFTLYANDETSEIINNYFIEIDGKLYVKNIEEFRIGYSRVYKHETLEVLSVNDTEASLKINYLDWYNNEKTLNFKMYGDPERSWIWYADTIL